MSKWYEVKIVAVKNLVVEMPDGCSEEEVENFALGESGLWDCADDIHVEELETDYQVNLAKVYADEVFPLEEEG